MKENKNIKNLLKLMKQLGLKEANKVYRTRYVVSSIADILKELYEDDKIFMRALFYKSNPIMSLIPKGDKNGK